MKYRQHDDALAAFSEIDAIEKTPRDDFARITMIDGKLIGCCDNGSQQAEFGSMIRETNSTWQMINY